MEIVTRKIKDLRPAGYNPRRLTSRSYGLIKDSLEKYGFVVPVVVNASPKRKDIIIGGHQRVKVWGDMGHDSVPCTYQDIEDIEKEKALNITLNKVSADWDEDKLMEWTKGELFNFGFKTHELKFFTPEIITQDTVGGRTDNPHTELGDTYQLNDHWLICDDCTKRKIEVEVDMLLTDPPYGVDYASKNEMLNKRFAGNRIQEDITNDNIKDYRKFFAAFISKIQFSSYNTLFIFMSGLYLHELRGAFDDAKIKWGDYLIWLKNGSVIGRKDYNSKYEFIVYGWKGRHKFYGESNSTTVLEYDRPLVSDLHPTMKPIGLLARLVRDGSVKGMKVYDPFMGSGSTLIGCEQTKRLCYGMEIDPGYCDVTIRRWIRYKQSQDEDISLKRNGKQVNRELFLS